jgi:DNA-binding CsgD family transcriptional regulator
VPTSNVVQNYPGQPDNCYSLLQEGAIFPILAAAIQDEIAFFSHDMTGNAVYVSKSAERVFNHNTSQWRTRPFWDFLSDAPENASIRSWKDSLESDAIGRNCEIVDRSGNRLKLKCWRVHVLADGVPVGVAGIVRRLNDCGQAKDCAEDIELLERAKKLTEVEKEVVEMVIDGMMNKEMAAKLNVAIRTIESRRSRAMAKLQTKSISELVQAWVKVRQVVTTRGSTSH